MCRTGQGYPNKQNKIKRRTREGSNYYIYSLYGTHREREKKIVKSTIVENEDIDDWLIIAELEPAIVAPGSVIPPFPARKRKGFKITKKIR